MPGTASASTAAAGVAVAIRGVTHAWGTTAALADITTDIEPGSFVAVVGASGCGKSTLLRLLAGMAQPTSGDIVIDGSTPDQVRRQRRIGWLAQRPALLPWRSLRDNVLLATQVHRDVVADTDPDDLIAMVGLDGFADALPAALSGGMQQRAALARTLALDAPLWLMDEPFAALDELTREALAADLVEIWRRRRPTVIWVTHHLGEAVALADRILVLSQRPGRIVADIAVDMPRPRDVTTPASQAIVRRARAALAAGGTGSVAGQAGVESAHDARPVVRAMP